MKAQVRLNDNFVFDLESETVAEMFQRVGDVQSVFGDLTCTWDGEEDASGAVEFVTRTVDEDTYYELRYAGSNPKLWGCQKKFGCNRKGGGLFPKYKDGEGNLLSENVYKNNGWIKYDKDAEKYV